MIKVQGVCLAVLVARAAPTAPAAPMGPEMWMRPALMLLLLPPAKLHSPKRGHRCQAQQDNRGLCLQCQEAGCFVHILAEEVPVGP